MMLQTFQRFGVVLLLASAGVACAQQQRTSPTLDSSGSCSRDKFGKQSGDVTVGMTIDATGQPTDVQALSSDHDDLIPCALDIARGSHFRPATKNGKPVQAHISMQIHVSVN
ncbi:energy transducer TonB [Granulicella cerasi]|uniref:Energy transducer TonB n=1 Tax=Granulicella cerasi TaxID=741063 RepID=A0ABW1Z9L7_9BACT|nr:energy transducer TonB [Granulicella cerasi]